MIILLCTQEQSKWRPILRRVDNTTDFIRDWSEYKTGFGNEVSNYWIGLDTLHDLTQSERRLQVYLETFEPTLEDIAVVFYDQFSVGNESTFYKLSISGYSGEIGDGLAFSNNMMFSTRDQDHDTHNNSCSRSYHCSWWMTSCFVSCPTGIYTNDGYLTAYAKGIVWRPWKEYYYSMKRLIISIM